VKISNQWKYISVLAGILSLAITVSCTRNLSVPVTALAMTPTPLATNTATATPNATQQAAQTATQNAINSFTPTYTTVPGAPTNTPNATQTVAGTATQNANATATQNAVNATATQNANLTLTPSSGATPWVIYSGLVPAGQATPIGLTTGVVDLWSGGGASNPATSANTSSPLYSSDVANLEISWSAYVSGGWTGASIAPATGTVNFTGFSTCTFYACANESGTAGFNAADPTSGCTATINESLTTSWQLISITITSGSRTDGCTGTLAACTDYFVAALPSSGAGGSVTYPFDVFVDQIQFQ
jgi:hypothetical protein